MKNPNGLPLSSSSAEYVVNPGNGMPLSLSNVNPTNTSLTGRIADALRSMQPNVNTPAISASAATPVITAPTATAVSASTTAVTVNAISTSTVNLAAATEATTAANLATIAGAKAGAVSGSFMTTVVVPQVAMFIAVTAGINLLASLTGFGRKKRELSAQDWNFKGWDEVREKNYPRAFACLKRAADMGHVDSMAQVGYLALNGIGVPANLSLAKQYYLLAADRGHVGAKNRIKVWSKITVCYDKEHNAAPNWNDPALSALYKPHTKSQPVKRTKTVVSTPETALVVAKRFEQPVQQVITQVVSTVFLLAKQATPVAAPQQPAPVVAQPIVHQPNPIVAQQQKSVAKPVVQPKKPVVAPAKQPIFFQPGGQEWNIRGWDAQQAGDYEKAFDCFKRAADLGHFPSMTQVAYRALNGIAVTASISVAKHYYSLAAAQGDAGSKKRVELINAGKLEKYYDRTHNECPDWAKPEWYKSSTKVQQKRK